MRKIAKTILLILMAVAVNINVFASNDTIKLNVRPSSETKNVNLVPADNGRPNIKYFSRYIAIPHNANFKIHVSTSGESIAGNSYVEPATILATDYDSIDHQSVEDSDIYSRDEFYPKEIVATERIPYLDFDLLLIGIAECQYNPARRLTKSFENIEVSAVVDGKIRITSSQSLLVDMIKGIVDNPDAFEETHPADFQHNRNGCDYLIVVPENEGMIAWADTLRNFREEQGIITKVVTLKEIGRNRPDSLKAYFKNARDTWDPSPEAILLFGDYYGIGLADGITTYMFTDHPEGAAFEPYFSDNQLVDFNKDCIPDIVIARMPAADADEARLMVEKTIRYERRPSTNASYYEKPVTAMGYQRSRWFQLCTEILAGYWERHGKRCSHINAIYEGTPDSVWSTGQNTNRVLQKFGPQGLGYIPATMSHLTDWSGNDNDISEAIENGTFMITHRDHGTYETWSQPHFSTSAINNLRNDELTFVLSANCQTGHFGIGDGYYDCFAERFLRIDNGAVAVIAASELSYSYVNDTYVWGLFDYLYPDFIPDYGAQNIDFQYPAFANAYGKLYLKQSSFPYNTDKIEITNKLFHYFGDAFLQLNSEMPEYIEISHTDTILSDVTSVKINAEDGTHVALSVDNQLIAKGKSENGEVSLNLGSMPAGTKIKVVATKQNHYRYESLISVASDIDDDGDDGSPFQIYPNPCSDEIVIKGDNIVNIVIFNVLGQIVKSMESKNSDFVKISTADLQSGIYVVKVNGVFTQKMFKTK